jgi:hypothetical protein
MYLEAFHHFLTLEKIPKQIPRVTRNTVKLAVPEDFPATLQSLRSIARKRQQKLNVVIEEALERFLDIPENHLGENWKTKKKIEKVVI